MTRVHVLPAAQEDFLEAVDYYAAINLDLAEDFVARVESAYEQIARQPLLFAPLETNRTDREVRRVRLTRFPYLVIYELIDRTLCVLAIMHASRHPDTWRR